MVLGVIPAWVQGLALLGIGLFRTKAGKPRAGWLVCDFAGIVRLLVAEWPAIDFKDVKATLQGKKGGNAWLRAHWGGYFTPSGRGASVSQNLSGGNRSGSALLMVCPGPCFG